MPYTQYTTENMRKLNEEFHLVDNLTQSLYDKLKPESGFLPTWHPAYFETIVKTEIVPYEVMSSLSKSDFSDYSFASKLLELPGVVRVNFNRTEKYPALLGPYAENERMGVFTIDFLRDVIDNKIIDFNVNALLDLKKILANNHVKVWFEIPEKAESSRIDELNATRLALRQAAKLKPIVFSRTISDSLYALGFDRKNFSSDEVEDLLNEILDLQ